ncbi:hypothetical protein Esti_004042 [Eimeria stiedai]
MTRTLVAAAAARGAAVDTLLLLLLLLLPQEEAWAFRLNRSGCSSSSYSSSSRSCSSLRVSVQLHAKKPSWHIVLPDRSSKDQQQQQQDEEAELEQQQQVLQQQQQVVLRMSLEEPTAAHAAAALGLQQQQHRAVYAELQQHAADSVGTSAWLSQEERDRFFQQQQNIYPRQQQQQQQQQQAGEEDDRGPYFSGVNVREYHRYNAYWSPSFASLFPSQSYGRPSLCPSFAFPFGHSPKRPIRESDLSSPSVPFGWRVFGALALAKPPMLLRHQPQQQQQKTASSSWMYVWDLLAHRRLHLSHLCWARGSARLPDVGGRVLSLLQLHALRGEGESDLCFQEKRLEKQQLQGAREGKGGGEPGSNGNSVRSDSRAAPLTSSLSLPLLSPYVGDFLLFTSPSLHHAEQFLLSSPKALAGLYSHQYLYECQDVTGEHLLLGKQQRRSAERDRLFAFFGFFKPPPEAAPRPPAAAAAAADPGEGSLRRAAADAADVSRDAAAAGASPAAAATSAAGDSFASAATTSKEATTTAATAAATTATAATAARDDERRGMIELLSEKQLRFLCRSNSVHRRCFLVSPRRDTAADVLLHPELLLPLTEQQKLRTLRRFKSRRQQALNAAAAAAADSAGSLVTQQQQQHAHGDENSSSDGKDRCSREESSSNSSTPVDAECEGAATPLPAAAAAAGHDSLTAAAQSLLQNVRRGLPAAAAAAAPGASVAAATSLADPQSIWSYLHYFQQQQQHALQQEQHQHQHQQQQHQQHQLQQQQQQQQQNAEDSVAEVDLACSAECEHLLFFGETEEEAKSLVKRLPFLSCYTGGLLTEAVPLDFYGKCGVLTAPSSAAAAGAAAAADADAEELGEEAETETEGEDAVEWLLQHKEALCPKEDASIVLDRPFYDEYLRNWVYLQLPEGAFAAQGPLPASSEEDFGGPPESAVSALNRDPQRQRSYVPGFWLFKPETKVLHRDEMSGGMLIGAGIDGSFSWDKEVSPQQQKEALVRMELALEQLRKGAFGTEETDDFPPTRVDTNSNHAAAYGRIVLSPEEKLKRMWGLKPLQESLGQVAEGDEVPAGMEFLSPERLCGRPAAYRRLVSNPTIVQSIFSEFSRKVEAGEADPEEHPFRMGPEELVLHEGFKGQKREATTKSKLQGTQAGTNGGENEEVEDDIPIAAPWRERSED